MDILQIQASERDLPILFFGRFDLLRADSCRSCCECPFAGPMGNVHAPYFPQVRT
ncbi:hypothetical protein HMPREF0262_00252 [Clostridium sp. ATCC 29733]|nr:hypothetical protein HMPREF0262_00252 [Clostridium sp. ATCC 29733]